MHISTDKQQPLSVPPFHQEHAVIFSQTFTYYPHNQHYRVIIFFTLFTLWYCWIWQCFGKQYAISLRFTKNISNI